MPSLRKVFEAVLTGRSDTNVRFDDLRRVLRRLGFSERVRGSHYIYSRQGVDEIVNIQEGAGGKAKPFQVKQVRELITMYKLTILNEG